MKEFAKNKYNWASEVYFNSQMSDEMDPLKYSLQIYVSTCLAKIYVKFYRENLYDKFDQQYIHEPSSFYCTGYQQLEKYQQSIKLISDSYNNYSNSKQFNLQQFFEVYGTDIKTQTIGNYVCYRVLGLTMFFHETKWRLITNKHTVMSISNNSIELTHEAKILLIKLQHCLFINKIPTPRYTMQISPMENPKIVEKEYSMITDLCLMSHKSNSRIAFSYFKPKINKEQEVGLAPIFKDLKDFATRSSIFDWKIKLAYKREEFDRKYAALVDQIVEDKWDPKEAYV